METEKKYHYSTRNSCEVKYELDENGEHEDRPTEIKCTCGCWNWYSIDTYGEWSCMECDQLYNAFGQRLSRSAWNAPDYGEYNDY